MYTPNLTLDQYELINYGKAHTVLAIIKDPDCAPFVVYRTGKTLDGVYAETDVCVNGPYIRNKMVKKTVWINLYVSKNNSRCDVFTGRSAYNTKKAAEECAGLSGYTHLGAYRIKDVVLNS